MSPGLWVLIGVVALLGEALNTQLFLLNTAVAAFIVAALAVFLGMFLGPSLQLALFVVLSLLLLGLVRPRLLHALAGHTQRRTLTIVGRLVDRAATVTQTVTAHSGTIRVGNADFWTARTNGPLPPIQAGRDVRIAYVDGLTAYVEPITTVLGEETLAPDSAPLMMARETQKILERGK